MANTTKEKHFENLIEAHLLEHGGYHSVSPTEYSRELALIPSEILAFVKETQVKYWAHVCKVVSNKVEETFIKELSAFMSSQGVLHVLRDGFPFRGKKFKLAYFRPASGLNPKTIARYKANRLACVRQLKYDPNNENSLDLALFLNGIPIITSELKNQFTSQNISHSRWQYKNDRDPKAPIFRFKERSLVHFAVDTDEVEMTTRLMGKSTFFLPFNKGHNGGAGNPPVEGKNRTCYLWEEVWQRDSILEIVQKFIFLQVEYIAVKGKEKPRKKETMIFPRYHQLGVVRRLLGSCLQNGAGTNYLIQHSAGSGKSNSIAWLAHRLATLHDAEDKKVYDCVVVLTDRKVLDQQLQQTISDMEHTEGVIAKIMDQGKSKSSQLADALDSGKLIIISTIHTYGHLHDKIANLPDRKYAIIVDEAHSSQSGEMATNVKKALASSKLIEEKMSEIEEDDSTTDALAEMAAAYRGKMNNLSFFAFTATPKHKTLRNFGVKGSDGQHRPFDLYSMKQAIEEGFILDVLKNYTTYNVFLKLVKKVESDPELDKRQGAKALGKYISLHPHNLAQKTEIIIEHFRQNIKHRLEGRAKAMVVTGSRMHAARYKLEFDKYIKSKGYQDLACLVAFSGDLVDADHLPGSTTNPYTELSMNNKTAVAKNLPKFQSEAELAERFAEEHFQILLVANKYQTGFDQPLLCAMYVDKVLDGIQAVQTLSRLNRTYSNKNDVFVLDFVNDEQKILKSFQDYYEGVTTAGDVEPNKLYILQAELMNTMEYDVLRLQEIENFATIFFEAKDAQKMDHGKLNSFIDPAVDRFKHNLMDEEEQETFRAKVKGFLSMYSFISQVVNFTDAGLEKLFVYSKFLLSKLPKKGKTAPVDIDGYQEIKYYKINKSFDGSLLLAHDGEQELYGPSDVGGGLQEDEKELLSELIEKINTEFAADFNKDDLVMLVNEPVEALKDNPEIRQAHKVNDFAGFTEALKQPYEDCLLEQHEQREQKAQRGTQNIEALFGNEEMKKQFFEMFVERLFKTLQKESA